MTFQHDGAGTDEARWQTWGALDLMPTLTLATGADGAGAPTRLVVLAAHPDDETLGAGGLIHQGAAAGVRVDVVVATDGEVSHPDSRTHDRARLAQRRRDEVTRAVASLNAAARLHLLDLGDGSLAERRAQLTGALAAVLDHRAQGEGKREQDGEHRQDAAGTGCWLVAPWRHDGHPDHDVAGQVAASLARERGLVLLEYPIWAWHWAEPDDERVPWADAVRLPLGPDDLAIKRAAIDHHRTQVRALSSLPGDEVLLGAEVLSHFTRDVEVYLRSGPDEPRSPASLDPAYFDALYAEHGTDPWRFADRWYEQRKRAVLLAALPRERFVRGFEPGCSSGILTEQLAARCDELVAVDVSAAAVQGARDRTAHLPGVRVDQGSLQGRWPEGPFDLVVVSEVGYYLSHDDLGRAVDRLVSALTADGVLVLCHWRHPVADYPLAGDVVHERVRRHPRLAVLVHHLEEDFVLDVLVPAPAVSVARATGMLE